MEKQEVLSEIKKEKYNIACGEARVKELESMLLGDENLIHTPIGFLKYLTNVWSLMSNLSLYESELNKANVKLSTRGNWSKHAISYNDEYDILIELASSGNDFVFRASRIKVDETKEEELIRIWSNTVKKFNDGKYTDFLKENMFDMLLNYNINKIQAEKLKEIEVQQKNFAPIEF